MLNRAPLASPLRMSLSPLSAAISVGMSSGAGGFRQLCRTTMDPLYLPTANLEADNMIRLFVLRSYVNRLGTLGFWLVGLFGLYVWITL